jgi:hypothetical protein
LHAVEGARFRVGWSARWAVRARVALPQLVIANTATIAIRAGLPPAASAC